MPAPIYDWAGRPLAKRQDVPGAGQFIFPNKGAWWDTLSADITPKLIIQYLKNAEQGILGQQMQLFDRMVDRDDRLQAVLETRKLAVTGVDRKIVPAIPDDPRAEKAADLVREHLANISMDDALSALLDGVPKGTQLVEIIWEGSQVVALNEVPGRLLKWIDGVLHIDTGDGKKENFQPIQNNKFVSYSPRTKPGGKERRGILRALSILWVAKHWALRDWAAFVEVFGMPLRLGKYPSGTSEENKAILYEALQDMGSDSAAMIPENMNIEFPRTLQTSTGSGTPMEELVDYVDKSYAIRVLGQNTSTQSESGSGTLAGNAHENVRKDYKKADAKSVGRSIERDLFAPIVGFNLGWDYPVPKMWFDVEDAQDDASRSKVYVELAKIPGMTFSRSQIREEFALREPIDEEDTLSVETEDASTGPIEAALRARAFALPKTPADLTTDGMSHGARASSDVARDLQRKAQDEWISIIFAYVDKLAAEVAEGPEGVPQLIRRIRLAAPDLGEAMSGAGLSLEDVEDAVSRAYLTSHGNGEQAVDNELAVQLNDEEQDDE